MKLLFGKRVEPSVMLGAGIFNVKLELCEVSLQISFDIAVLLTVDAQRPEPLKLLQTRFGALGDLFIKPLQMFSIHL